MNIDRRVSTEILGVVDIYEIDYDTQAEGPTFVAVLGELAVLAEMQKGPLIRLHSRCEYGEVFGSDDCDCGPQLRSAQEQIANEGSGILFYLEGQEGRGAGIITKAKGYVLKDQEGLDTAEAYERLGVPFDQREYGHCAKFLIEHGIKKIRLLSNNPRKVAALTTKGIEVEVTPLIVGISDQNKDYLRVKRDKAGHLLPEDL